MRCVVNAVSAANVKAHVEHITTQIPSRLAGSANGKRMAEYSARRTDQGGRRGARPRNAGAGRAFRRRPRCGCWRPSSSSIEANTLGHSLPTLPDGISAELIDVASGAFGDYEGRDATGKITLSELSYHPARHEKQRIAALMGADRLRDDELGASGEHGRAVRLGEAGLGQSDARDLQDRDADAALHRHRPHRRTEAARDAEGRARCASGCAPMSRTAGVRCRSRSARSRRRTRRLRRGRRPSGFLARPAGDRQCRRQCLHHGAGARLPAAPRQAAARARVRLLDRA